MKIPRVVQVLASALVAFPSACIELARPRRDTRPRLLRRIARLPLALVQTAMAIVATVIIASAVSYPFRALGADGDMVEDAWGGPTAVGATLANWGVAVAAVAAAYVLIRVLAAAGDRVCRSSRSTTTVRHPASGGV